MKALSTIFISLFNSIWLILLIPAFSAPAGSSFLGFSQSTVQAQTTGQGQSSLNAQDLSNVRADDITDAQLRAFINRAEEEGLSEADAFALARERGLPASEEQKLRRRIAELEGERAQDTSSQIGQLEPVRTTPDTSTTQSESDAEIESEAVQRTVRSLDDE